MLQHILTWYYLFFPQKTFSCFWGVGVVQRCWERGERNTIPPPPPPPTTCHNFLAADWGGSLFLSLILSFYFSLYFALSFSLFLYIFLFLNPTLSPYIYFSLFLSLSLFSISLPIYSLYPLSSVLIVSLSLWPKFFSLSLYPLFWPRDGVCPQRERVLWKRGGKENDNYWVLEPGRGEWYKVRTQLPIPHTYLPRGKRRRGGVKVENGNTQRINHVQIHKLPVSPRLSHTNY